MDKNSIAETKKAWNRELEFLRDELKAFDEALPHAIGMLNNWAPALN